MRARWSKTIPLALALLWAVGPNLPAAEPSQTASSRLPPGSLPSSRLVTPEDLKEPEISKPEDPGVPCVVNVTKDDETQAKLAGVKIGDQCLPQSDAFKRAAEAASYLAFYQQNYSEYAARMRDPQEKAKVQKIIMDCVGGSQSCGPQEQQEVLAALVQYNFGKELKAQMLENSLRHENMKSIDLGPRGWQEIHAYPTRILSYKNSLKTGSLRKYTFRLDPTKVEVLNIDSLSQAERDKLGAAFNAGFKEFVNEYTSSTGNMGQKSRWFYVPAVNVAGGNRVFVPAPDGRNLDAKLGKTFIDKGRMDRDNRVENSKGVQEIIGNYVKEYGDSSGSSKREVKIETAKTGETRKVEMSAMQEAYYKAGFGLPLNEKHDPKTGKELTPKEVASAVVLTINKDIYTAEHKLKKNNPENSRQPASPGAEGKPRTITSAVVDVKAFDKFLDSIWPPTAAKPGSSPGQSSLY